MKKYLLPGMMATLMFAACTSEEFVSQQTEAPKADFSNRPVVGQVDLNFGPQTRMGLGSGYNGFEFAPDDKLGARLIDKVNEDKKGYANHQFRYQADNSYAHSNYEYKRDASGTWTTEALLVEGNYMFYAPYNEEERGRGPLNVEFPINQTINPASEKVAVAGIKKEISANVDAVANFFKGENKAQTAFIGHYFLDGTKSETAIEPAYNHLYAYPVITLVNDYKESKAGEAAAGMDITLSRVIISSDNIYNKYTADHTGIMIALQNSAVEYKAGSSEVKESIELGTWRTKDGANAKSFLLNETTSQILNPVTSGTGIKNGDITVEFEGGLTIPAGESFSFHVVMPAAKYAKNNLTITPVFEDKDGNKWTWSTCKFEIDANNYTFAPGMWCPSEEYNVETTDGKPTYKESAGSLTEFSIAGDKERYMEPAKDLTSARALADWLEENNFDHSIALIESSETFTFAKEELDIDGDGTKESYSVVKFDRELMDVVKKYLVTGSIQFASNMLATGDLTGDYAVDGNKYKFNGGLDQLDGKIALSGVSRDKAEVAGDSRFMGEATLTNVTIGGSAVFNGVATLTDVTISGSAVFNGKATLTNVTANGTTINGAGSVVKGTSALGETTVLKNATIEGTTEVAALAVKGNITVDYKSTGASGNMTISEGATVNLSKAYPAAITVGSLNNANPKVMTEGILNIKESQNKAITLTMGDVTIDAGKSIAAGNLTWNDGYATTLNNKGTITVETAGTFEVPANGTYQHNGTVSGGGIKVAAGGTIENNGDIIVAKNDGTIKAMNAETHTTVTAGTGTVGNDYLAYVSANSDQTVYYTFKKNVEDADLTSFDSETYAINKLIFDENIKVALSDLSTADLDEVKTVEFKNGSSLSVGANGKIGVNIKTVEINGGVKFSGFAKDKSGFGFKKGATININPDATLEVAHLQLVTMSSTDGLNFNLKSDENDDNTGVLKITNAIVALGMAVAPVHTIDDASTITNSWYNGTDLVNQAAAAVNAALQNGDKVILVDNLGISSSFKVTRDAIIDLNGKNITATKADVFEVTNGTLTINGTDESEIFADGSGVTTGGVCAVWANGGNVVINGGYFKTNDDKNDGRNDLIYAKNGGDITINGGKFEYVGDNGDGHKFLLNCSDKSSSLITVNGGLFKNHVPSYEDVAPDTYTEVVLGNSRKVYKWNNANNTFESPKTAITAAHNGSETWYRVD